ncbi:MAG TPA: hypothetical protein VK771_09790 [Acidimicrobiia bacterium]|jgi:hypothetical protein|nr:hypothetical protein [Acidimicrobiia bacterium]
MSRLGDGWDKERINAQIRYHSEISLALTSQRTALESALIPVTAYILVACVECYRRYPDIIEEIAGAVPPDELGRAGHRFATQVDNVHLWAIPNFTMIGRKVLATAGMVDRDDDMRRMAVVFDFWDRAARAYRFDDGSRQAWDADGVATPYRAHVDELVGQCRPVEGDRLARLTRLNALLTSYLFLLWFDTRSGYQDTGPYLLDDGRVLLLRAFNGLGPSHLPWSAAVASEMPYSEVLAAFILDGVDLHVTDFGTSVTSPEDYLSRVVQFALFDVASGVPRPILDDGVDALAAAAKAAQRQLYRTIAGMERRAKIDAGAYVYFTFLRPFAELAGVGADWTVPRDSVDLYPLLELVDGAMPGGVEQETVDTYYAPIP